jgi:hypothetical protein
VRFFYNNARRKSIMDHAHWMGGQLSGLVVGGQARKEVFFSPAQAGCPDEKLMP